MEKWGYGEMGLWGCTTLRLKKNEGVSDWVVIEQEDGRLGGSDKKTEEGDRRNVRNGITENGETVCFV